MISVTFMSAKTFPAARPCKCPSVEKGCAQYGRCLS